MKTVIYSVAIFAAMYVFILAFFFLAEAGTSMLMGS